MLFALVMLGTPMVAQTTPDHQQFLAQLQKEADLFERTAHRIAASETLRQTIPAGVRVSRGPRGSEIALPAVTREIVSEYGFVSLDEPGGSIREVRRVLKVDGLTWNKPSTSLTDLAKEISARDAKTKRRQLESLEDHGLRGFVSDFGQVILLFARGGTARYEITFESRNESGFHVYRYQQLDGKEGVTVYGEGNEAVVQKIAGKIWVHPLYHRPMMISVESDRKFDGSQIRDNTEVHYAPSSFGVLVPARIVHQQFVDDTLVVTDEFLYTDFREVLPKVSR
jgi:hypothetical protein